MIFLCILIRLVFSFYISYTSNALIKMVEILFSKEKAPKREPAQNYLEFYFIQCYRSVAKIMWI